MKNGLSKYLKVLTEKDFDNLKLDTDFNINFGLWLGHGLLFEKYSYPLNIAKMISATIINLINNPFQSIELFVFSYILFSPF